MGFERAPIALSYLEEPWIHHGRPVRYSQQKLQELFSHFQPPLASNCKQNIPFNGKSGKQHCRPSKGDNKDSHCHSSDKDCCPQGHPEASDMETEERLGSNFSCQDLVEAAQVPLPEVTQCQAGP